ncbi:MAG: hypothetical protein CMA63_04660 [Euryarchaeota archaeon]|nr:hypothetical protein [Euryarchaeota archaeon]
MDPNLQLMLYVIPTVVGFLLVLPFSKALTGPLVGTFPSLATERGRLFGGLKLITLSGFAVSVQTLWISSKVSEGGNYCSSTSVFSCDDVIGNSMYNTDPVFGLPWGGIGMMVFALLLYFTLTTSAEPNELWVSNYLKMGTLVTVLGIPVILLLISYEYKIEKICQYCTTAHVANIAALVGFFRLMRMSETPEWNEKPEKKVLE